MSVALAVNPASPAAVECCFHCGAEIPRATDFHVTVDGRSEPMCCTGCAAVAEAIVAGGLSDYYRHRSALPQAADTVPAALRDLLRYDRAAAQAQFVIGPEDRREAMLMLEGIRCAACVWLNERHVARIAGVHSFHINYATQRAYLIWDARRVALSDILAAVAAIGYRAYPFEPSAEQERFDKERRKRLRELAVAGVFGMQVMMLAEALYAGAFFGIEPEFRVFFQYASLVLTLPVLLYSAVPFFVGAMRDLRLRRAGIDIPIALGIALAFGASAVATVARRGDVYYDAATMFVFLLLAGRYFEFNARRRALYAIDRLTPPLPATALRMNEAGVAEPVALADIAVGDRIVVPPGDAIPIDGTVVGGRSSVDESLLTGESAAQTREIGMRVIAGSINIESPIEIAVESVGAATVIADIKRLVARAQTQRPYSAERADRAAVWLVAAVLISAAVAGLYWFGVAPAQALPIVVAMLVVTCPCALALATPVAYTVAMRRLAQQGLIVTRADAIERLAEVTDAIFDKTGTLTHGVPRLIGWHVPNEDARAPGEILFSERREDAIRTARAQRLRVAAALAAFSEHPLARALRAAAPTPNLSASDVVNTVGGGLVGSVDNQRYILGSPAFVAAQTGFVLDDVRARAWCVAGHSLAVLASARAIEAVFAFDDTLRDDARATVAELVRAGKRVWLLSGDHLAAATHIANRVGIEQVRAGLSPQEKIAHVQALQHAGATVAMIGDGVNDAPALAAADVSIAMGQGTRLAHTAAAIVLLAPRLHAIVAGINIARATRRVVRQNIAFAIAYNVIVLPLAAFGWVTPWIGALGMSLSSVAVTANALRMRAPNRPPALHSWK